MTDIKSSKYALLMFKEKQNCLQRNTFSESQVLFCQGSTKKIFISKDKLHAD